MLYYLEGHEGNGVVREGTVWDVYHFRNFHKSVEKRGGLGFLFLSHDLIERLTGFKKAMFAERNYPE